MSTAPIEALGWDDLPVVCAESAARMTAHARRLARQVFNLQGDEICFMPAEGETGFSSPEASSTGSTAGAGLWLQVEHHGRPVLAQVSPHWVASALAAEGWSTGSIKGQVLASWCALRWVERMPASLVLVGVAESADGLSDSWRSLPRLGGWRGRHAGTLEASGYEVVISADTSVAVEALMQHLAGLAVRMLESPLRSLQLDLPMVGARWTVDAAELADLAVGDVLLVG